MHEVDIFFTAMLELQQSLASASKAIQMNWNSFPEFFAHLRLEIQKNPHLILVYSLFLPYLCGHHIICKFEMILRLINHRFYYYILSRNKFEFRVSERELLKTHEGYGSLRVHHNGKKSKRRHHFFLFLVCHM